MTEFVDATVNGRWLLRLPAVRAEFHEARPGWEAARLSTMAAVIEPHDVVYDVGAEQGDLSALYASWAWNGGVVLVEPEAAYWPQTAATWRENGLPDPLACFAGFASDTDLLDPPEREPGSGLHVNRSWPPAADGPIAGGHGFRNLSERAHDTPQITLDTLADFTGFVPDVVTIDVEGAELRVLLGARDILAEDRPVVFVSVHPDPMADVYDDHPDALHDWMIEAHGYEATHLATDHEQHWMYTHPEGRTLP